MLLPIVVVLIIFVVGYYLYSRRSASEIAQEAALLLQTEPTSVPTTVISPTEASPVPTVVPTVLPNGLKIEDQKVGQGKEAKEGDTISIHYIGTLADGKKFDSSYDRGQPFETQIGVGQVIKGWDKGVLGMKVGGKRRLTIPPELGYGATGAGNVIPPNATLIFEVELIGIL